MQRWHIIEVMPKGDSDDRWVALVIDVEPEIFARDWHCHAERRYLELGRQRSREAAWDRAEELIATRH